MEHGQTPQQVGNTKGKQFILFFFQSVTSSFMPCLKHLGLSPTAKSSMCDVFSKSIKSPEYLTPTHMWECLIRQLSWKHKQQFPADGTFQHQAKRGEPVDQTSQLALILEYTIAGFDNKDTLHRQQPWQPVVWTRCFCSMDLLMLPVGFLLSVTWTHLATLSQRDYKQKLQRFNRSVGLQSPVVHRWNIVNMLPYSKTDLITTFWNNGSYLTLIF